MSAGSIAFIALCVAVFWGGLASFVAPRAALPVAVGVFVVVWALIGLTSGRAQR